MQWPIQVPIPLPNWFMGLFKLSLFIIYHILFNVQIVSTPFPNNKNWKLKMRSYILGGFQRLIIMWFFIINDSKSNYALD